MPLQAGSLGPEVEVWTPKAGAVHSVFDRAVNLLVDRELWTVLATERQDLPFGIRLAPCVPSGGFGVRPSDPVHVRAGYIGIGSLTIDCRMAPSWSKAPWAPSAIGLGNRLSKVERVARSRAWPESLAIAGDVTQALRVSAFDADTNLAATVRQNVGRGPGLTPSGDDVIVGILAVLTSGFVGPTGVRDASRLVRALAPALRSTPEVSRHLLDQAARGLPGRALHDFGKSLVEGAPEDVLDDALALVLDTGSTSGADACLGLVAACRLSFLPAERLAA